MGRLLNTRQAAELLGIKRVTVNNYTSRGKLHPTTRSIGGRPLYDEDELLKLLGRDTPDTTPQTPEELLITPDLATAQTL